MPDKPVSPRIILVAGVPRSGSTWQFNAARLLLSRAGIPLQAVWIESYAPDHPAPVHLVKAHLPSGLSVEPEVILTTRRPAEACLASLIRMGWLADDPEAIRAAWREHRVLEAHWAPLSDLEIPYETILGDPARALSDLAATLGLTPRAEDIRWAATRLAAMRPPAGGTFDPETLLHPKHRREASDAGPSAADIVRIVGQASGGSAGPTGIS